MIKCIVVATLNNIIFNLQSRHTADFFDFYVEYDLEEILIKIMY